MQLKELKNHFKHMKWNSEVLAVDFNPKGILSASFSHLLEAEDEISVSYFWYDHLTREIRPDLISRIEDALNNHDFEEFLNLTWLIESEDIMITLPDQATVCNETKGIILGNIYLDDETFYLITEHEYECG